MWNSQTICPSTIDLEGSARDRFRDQGVAVGQPLVGAGGLGQEAIPFVAEVAPDDFLRERINLDNFREAAVALVVEHQDVSVVEEFGIVLVVGHAREDPDDLDLLDVHDRDQTEVVQRQQDVPSPEGGRLVLVASVEHLQRIGVKDVAALRHVPEERREVGVLKGFEDREARDLVAVGR